MSSREVARVLIRRLLLAVDVIDPDLAVLSVVVANASFKDRDVIAARSQVGEAQERFLSGEISQGRIPVPIVLPDD
jgi:hypothetical protein